MKIAVLGPGAMGQLFGAYLSKQNEVLLVGHDPARAALIGREGVTVRERDATECVYRPAASTGPEGFGPADLVVLFTKSSASRAALEHNRALLGPETCLLTLQNGAGHEELLKEFAPAEQILIGTTQQGASLPAPNVVCHSGLGVTWMGAVCGDPARFDRFAQAFSACGLPTQVSGEVEKLIWSKVMLNSSCSVLSGILQTAQGYAADDPDAWSIAEQLVRETCAVANADGMTFDPEEQLARVRKSYQDARAGFVSIYADLRDGRRTEVDNINGAVVRAGQRLGVPTPTHSLILRLVHALERRAAYDPSTFGTL